MAIEITNTVIDDADAYFANRLESTAWELADDPTKNRALKTASTILNNMSWVGTPTGVDYAFPRYLPNSNVPTTPLKVLQALYEQSLHLLQNPSVLHTEEAVESLVLGPLKLEKIKPVGLVAPLVFRLISDFTAGGSAGGASWWRAN